MPYIPIRTGIKDITGFPLYGRDRVTDDIANDILGFDNAMNPWVPANIPGGAGNWSTSIGAGVSLDTTTYPHFLHFDGAASAAVTYVQWTNAVAKTQLYFNISNGYRVGAADGLVFEVRCWDAQAPGAATPYVAARWRQDRTGVGAYQFRFGWWYGTGITFAPTDGTLIVANGESPWQTGDPYRFYMNSFAGPNFYALVNRSEGGCGLEGVSAAAGLPVSWKTIWFYMPISRYEHITLDDIHVLT